MGIGDATMRISTLWGYFKTFQATMKSGERILKEIVEKYEKTICFMVDKDQCLMEAVEPRIVWILPMGYEVDAATLDAYAQHMMSQSVDEKEERFGTFKEKDLELHKQFTAPARKRKVSKMAEEVVVQMRYTLEAVKQAREKHAQMEGKEETKKPKAELVPSKAKPKETKSAPTSVVPSLGQSSSRKGILKQKEKPKQTYVIVSPVASETESDEEAVKAKMKGEFVRVVRKPQSGGEEQSKKAKSEPTLTGRPKRGRKIRIQLDKNLESRDQQGKYTFVPPLTTDQLIDEITVDGNLKHIGVYYENLVEVDQRKVEEAVVLHLHNFSKSLIELERSIPKDLYNIIDARRLTVSKIDEKMKERELINVCTYVSQDEAKRLIEEANKKEFRRRNRVNRLMIGRVEEVRKETEDIWRRIMKNNPLYSDAVQTSHPEVKEGVFSDKNDETQIEEHPEDQGNATLDVEISANPSVVDSAGEISQIQKDDNAPSGNTGAHNKGDGAKVKEPEKSKVDKGKGVVDPAIDTPPVTRTLPQISINLDGPLDLGQMSLAEKLMLAVVVQARASQDLVKSESEDRKLILMSVDVLQKVVPRVQLDPNSSPFGKLLQLINSTLR